MKSVKVLTKRMLIGSEGRATAGLNQHCTASPSLFITTCGWVQDKWGSDYVIRITLVGIQTGRLLVEQKREYMEF